MEGGRRDDGKSGIALVSVNFGGIDTIKSFPPTPGLDTYLYTDAATLSGAEPSALSSWGKVIVPDYPRHDFGTRLRSRYFKHQIQRLPEMENYRWLAWADTSLLFRDASFLLRKTEQLAALPGHQRLALVPHPDRKSVREEYEFIQGRIEQGNEYLTMRYGKEKMTEQMQFFASRGWNVDAPSLWCGGFWIVENSDLIASCWNAWWDQNIRYGVMDQLALPVLLEQSGLEPQAMDLNIWKNDYFEFVAHHAAM